MRHKKDLLPEELKNITQIIGFEDDDDKDDKNSGSGSEDDDDDDDGDDDKGKGSKDEGNDGLKSALRKERQSRRALEKELKTLKSKQQEADDKDKSESEKAKEAAAQSKAKAEKLAKKLRDTAVDNAIIKLSGKLKFRDIDDALRLIDRDDLEIDQDEDDPADIQIDEKSVEEALKALAKKKPHLIGSGEGEGGDKSGSKFNGGKKTQQDADDEALYQRYPALNRSRATQPSNS